MKRLQGSKLKPLVIVFCQLTLEGQPTNVGALDVVAECQKRADGFGVSLLYQQLNDGLSIGVNQVLALARQRARQVSAYRLHGFDHLLLKRTNTMDQHECSAKPGNVSGLAVIRLDTVRTSLTSVDLSSSLLSNSFITYSQIAQNLDSRTRTRFCNPKKRVQTCVQIQKTTVSGQAAPVSYQGRLLGCRFHLGGWEKLGGRNGLGGRYGFGGLQFQHGSGLGLGAEAGVGADIFGFLRRESKQLQQGNHQLLSASYGYTSFTSMQHTPTTNYIQEPNLQYKPRQAGTSATVTGTAL